MREAIDFGDGPTERQQSVRSVRLLHAVGIWIGLVIVAILNAMFRETILVPRLDDYPSHVASTGTLVSALAVIACLYFDRYTDHSVRELVVIGLLWATMTVLFEFGFGHYVMDNPWSVLMADYNLLRGRVWLFVPLSMLLFPLLFGWYLKRN